MCVCVHVYQMCACVCIYMHVCVCVCVLTCISYLLSLLRLTKKTQLSCPFQLSRDKHKTFIFAVLLVMSCDRQEGSGEEEQGGDRQGDEHLPQRAGAEAARGLPRHGAHLGQPGGLDHGLEPPLRRLLPQVSGVVLQGSGAVCSVSQPDAQVHSVWVVCLSVCCVPVWLCVYV